MCEVLGDPPNKWLTFPYFDGYPVHDPLQPDAQYETLESASRQDVLKLEQYVRQIAELRRPANSAKPRTGTEKFCLAVPVF
jgi:hypothetical protein